jgi:hypothetical protein
LQPEGFEECFRAWVASMRRMLPGEIVAIDGKSLRRSHDRGAGVSAAGEREQIGRFETGG